jgi:BlaI family penicillinase repressor
LTDRTPSGRELEILKILWDAGPSTVRQVHEQMAPDGELAFNTVQTLLRIMDDKGLVEHKREGRTFVYSPRRTRENETSRLVDKMFDGSLDQLVVSLLSSRKVSDAELKKLEQIISAARKRKEPSRKGK